MVYIASLEVTRKGQKKLFQLERKVLMDSTARMVLDRGSTIWVKILGWLQPSNLALSSSEVGMLEKNCLVRKMLYDVTRPGSTSAA